MQPVSVTGLHVFFSHYMKPLALITDFGTTDWYIGALKGSIISIDRNIVIIDITHHIPMGAISTAAFILCVCNSTFPKGTVFCTVVDPGVRSQRRVIAASVNDRFFVGPDNGVLSWLLNQHKRPTVRSIDVNSILNDIGKKELLQHDLIGPVAALIASRNIFTSLGPIINNYVEYPFPESFIKDQYITTTIIAIDRFGNIITSLRNTALDSFTFPGTTHLVFEHKSVQTEIVHTYCEVAPNTMLLYPGSSGYVEIGVNNGSALNTIECAIGDTVSFILP